MITDLTQMRQERLCIAGLTEQLECVRLDVGYPGIMRDHLFRDEQLIIRPRAVVNAEIEPDFRRKEPHIEDHHWLNPEETTFENLVDDERWRSVLSRTAYPSLESVFDVPLVDNRKLPAWTGVRSLGTIKAKYISKLVYSEDKYQERGYRCRLNFRDETEQFYAMLPVVDLAMIYYAEYLRVTKNMPPEEVEKFLTRILRQADEVWLRIGLTRPWGRDEGELFSYVQVSGIYTFPDYLRGNCFADYEV